MLGDQPAPPDAATIGQPIFYLLVAFVVLAIPTGFMGATLPLLLRYAVRTDREVGPRVALLYAINTAGAVCGTLAAALVLLPALGLNRTVWVGVAVNALLFVIAAALARGRRDSASADETVAAAGPPSFVTACMRPLVDDVMHFSRFGLNGVEDLLAALAMDEQGVLSFARRAEISTDDNNLMATRSRARADGLTPDDLLELFEPYDPMVRPGSWIHTQLGEGIDYGYIARRLMSRAQTPRANRLAEAIPDFSRQFEVYGRLLRATGQGAQASESFTNALLANPLNMQVRYTVARDYLGPLSRIEVQD